MKSPHSPRLARAFALEIAKAPPKARPGLAVAGFLTVLCAELLEAFSEPPEAPPAEIEKGWLERVHDHHRPGTPGDREKHSSA